MRQSGAPMSPTGLGGALHTGLAVVLGALMLHGITPGPNLVKEKAGPLLGRHRLHVHRQLHAARLEPSARQRLRQRPSGSERLLLPLLVLLCVVGVYSVNSSYLDLVVLAVFGFVGYASAGSGSSPRP